MALPIYRDITIYRGDTFVEKIFPKNADGTAFVLKDSNDVDYFAYFYIAGTRNFTASLNSYYTFVDSNENSITYSIKSTDAATLIAGTPYVYEIKIKHPSNNPAEVYTLVTGTLNINPAVKVEQ